VLGAFQSSLHGKPVGASLSAISGFPRQVLVRPAARGNGRDREEAPDLRESSALKSSDVFATGMALRTLTALCTQ
jgi:hypothetical protein